MEFSPINAGDPAEMERGIAAFARSLNGGLIVTVGGTAVRRDLIIAAAAKYRLPAVYPYSYFVSDGGLISYGPDTIEPYLRAAGYVDRIFKGEKPANLPAQAPTKYRLAVPPQDRQDARPHGAALAAGPRRRGDRISR